MFCQRVSFLSGFFVDSTGPTSSTSSSSGCNMSTPRSWHSLAPSITIPHSTTPSKVTCLQIYAWSIKGPDFFREREIFGSISSVHSQGAMSHQNAKLRRSNSHVESIVWKKRKLYRQKGDQVRTCSDRKMNS